ncbi:hypothetical protein GS592_26010 [Rhodococcus hoagii]|nr:hypothetical protein [Prescottella equi]
MSRSSAGPQGRGRLKAKEAETIAKLVMQGYTSDSVVTAVIEGDWRLLSTRPVLGPAVATGVRHGPGGAAGASKSNANQPDPGDNGKTPNDADDKPTDKKPVDNKTAGKEKKQ